MTDTTITEPWLCSRIVAGSEAFVELPGEVSHVVNNGIIDIEIIAAAHG